MSMENILTTLLFAVIICTFLAVLFKGPEIGVMLFIVFILVFGGFWGGIKYAQDNSTIISKVRLKEGSYALAIQKQDVIEVSAKRYIESNIGDTYTSIP